MKTGVSVRVAVLVCAAIAGASCSGSAPEETSRTATPAAPAQSSNPVERGQYLVTVMACNDCHTPFRMGANGPEPDMSRMLSGHQAELVMPPPPRLSEKDWAWAGAATNTAFAGPWGISYAANITPDETTGIGSWTDEMFLRAFRLGQHIGASRPIQPPMPWQWMGKMTDEDLKAIFAYLRTVPAIVNQVPAYQPPTAQAK
jgi:hypothetical protein